MLVICAKIDNHELSVYVCVLLFRFTCFSPAKTTKKFPEPLIHHRLYHFIKFFFYFSIHLQKAFVFRVK